MLKRTEERDDLKSSSDYTVLDSIYEINNAWRFSKQSTLVKSRRKSLPAVEIIQDDMPFSILANLAKSVNGGVNVDEDNIVEWRQ